MTLKRSLLLVLLAVRVFAQYGPGVLPPRYATATKNLYISTGGSDSNPCTSASKCLTLAHALTLIPQTLDQGYIVNVADGTYAEGIDTSGFSGSGSLFGGTHLTYLKVLGNTTTPANVVFTGTIQCDGGFMAGACIVGPAQIYLSGLTITHGQRNGIACYNGNVDYNKVLITLTGGASAVSVGMNNLGCNWNHSGNLTVSGFDTNTAPTGGLGVYNANGTVGTCSGGTLTITGPATGADYHGTVGLVIEYAPSGFTHLDPSCTISITGVQTGLLVNDNGTFTSYVASTISISNASTPTGSIGINTSGGGAVNLSSPTLTLNHWTTCYLAAALSVIDHGNGTRTSTNCGTISSAIQGSQIILF